MARPKGWHAVKSRLSYTIEEAARNQGVCRATVRRWLKEGLPCLDEQRPTLILGADLIAFLKARKAPKHIYAPDEFFCFRCKAPRKPALGEIECRAIGPSRKQLVALCPDCTTVMHKAVSQASLARLRGVPGLTISMVDKAISPSTSPG